MSQETQTQAPIEPVTPEAQAAEILDATAAPVAQTATTEQPVTTPEPDAEPKLTASDFARFKAKADALKAKEHEYKANAVKLQQMETQLNSLRDLARSNPAALIDELGIDPQGLIDSLTQPYLDPTQQLKRELEELKGQLSRREQEEHSAREAQSWENVQQTFAQHVQSTPDLELLQSELSADPGAVYNTLRSMVEIANERGETITFRQAASKYEDYLTNQAMRYAGSNKIKARFAPQPAPVKQEQATQTPQQEETARPKTINNAAAAEAAPPKVAKHEPSPVMKQIMEEQEKRRAIIEKLQKVRQ